MIDEGQIGEAFKDEVSTIYEEHRDKYRSGLEEAWSRAQEMGWITPEDPFPH